MLTPPVLIDTVPDVAEKFAESRVAETVPVTRPYESIDCDCTNPRLVVPVVFVCETVARSILSALTTILPAFAVARSIVFPVFVRPSPALIFAVPVN